MKQLYKVVYTLHHPDSDNEKKTAFVLADSFLEADKKVTAAYTREYCRVYVIYLEILEGFIE